MLIFAVVKVKLNVECMVTSEIRTTLLRYLLWTRCKSPISLCLSLFFSLLLFSCSNDKWEVDPSSVELESPFMVLNFIDDIGDIPDNFCRENSNLNKIILTNNNFCPCYPSCIEDAGVQDISECIICENGFEQVCTVPSSAIIDSDSTECFNSAHLEVLRAIIDSSLATLPDSLDYLMDADSSGTIEPMELGSQFWENSLLTYLDVNNRGLSGRLPNSILDLNSLFVLNLAHNYLDGEIPFNICYFVNLLPLNWDASISSGLNSNLFNNRLCPPYPDCIAPYVGEQNTSNCPESESP